MTHRPSNPPGPAAAAPPFGEAGEADPSVPPRQCYRLEIRPDAPGRPWSAALVSCPGGMRAEFTSPLALLRFIARTSGAAPRGGLR